MTKKKVSLQGLALLKLSPNVETVTGQDSSRTKACLQSIGMGR